MIDAVKAGRRYMDMALRSYTYDPTPKLPHIKAPTLVIGLTRDYPFKRPKDMGALIANSRLVIVEGNPVTATYTIPQELARIMLDFTKHTPP